MHNKEKPSPETKTAQTPASRLYSVPALGDIKHKAGTTSNMGHFVSLSRVSSINFLPQKSLEVIWQRQTSLIFFLYLVLKRHTIHSFIHSFSIYLLPNHHPQEKIFPWSFSRKPITYLQLFLPSLDIIYSNVNLNSCTVQAVELNEWPVAKDEVMRMETEYATWHWLRTSGLSTPLSISKARVTHLIKI